MAVITLEYFTPPDALGTYAGICYGREGNNEKRLRHIIKVGHLAVLRFGHATFKIEEISRVALAQLTRSKHLDYLVRSSRYCEESDADYARPPSLATAPLQMQNGWIQHENHAKALYKQALAAGMTKEDARYILPQAQETQLYVTGNYQAWVDFFRLRTAPAAQHEVRDIAIEMEDKLQRAAPIIFDKNY